MKIEELTIYIYIYIFLFSPTYDQIILGINIGDSFYSLLAGRFTLCMNKKSAQLTPWFQTCKSEIPPSNPSTKIR